MLHYEICPNLWLRLLLDRLLMLSLLVTFKLVDFPLREIKVLDDEHLLYGIAKTTVHHVVVISGVGEVLQCPCDFLKILGYSHRDLKLLLFIVIVTFLGFFDSFCEFSGHCEIFRNVVI